MTQPQPGVRASLHTAMEKSSVRKAYQMLPDGSSEHIEVQRMNQGGGAITPTELFTLDFPGYHETVQWSMLLTVFASLKVRYPTWTLAESHGWLSV